MRVVSSQWIRGMLLALIYTLGLIGIVASGGGGGGGGGDEEEADARVEISGAILVPGGTASAQNPIGLQGAANRPVSLYRIDDSGTIIGDVLETGTSDTSGNYVLLLPENVQFSSDLIVEAQLDNNVPPQLARAIVIDESTDVTPITEYITQKLIDAVPPLDLSALPVSEVNDLIEFVESLPLGPQPDLTTLLVEIADFSDLAIQAQINNLNPANPQVQLSGLLSVPGTPAVPREAGVAMKLLISPVANQLVELYQIDSAGNTVGAAIQSTTTDDDGIFSMVLPVGQDLIDKVLVGQLPPGNRPPDALRALVTGTLLNIGVASELAFRKITGRPDVDISALSDDQIDELVTAVETSVDTLETLPDGPVEDALTELEVAVGPTIDAAFDTFVSEANVTAPVIAAAGPFSLAENSANATDVGTVIATDADPVGNVTDFNITAGNSNAAFAIDPAGAITVANTTALDRETIASFILTITATDGTNTSAGADIIINLTDENDNAPIITANQAFAVGEDAGVNDPVGNVSATDADTSGITNFSITGGNTGNAFTIDAAGAITVANAGVLDRESLSLYTLSVEATDGVNTSAVESVTVTINDANDNAPVVDAVGPFVVAEDAPNTTQVGVVTATDVDTAGAIIDFAIIAGNTGAVFAINAGGVITVADTSAIDFENAPSFTLTVTATDGVNTSVGQAVTINIGDVNDTAPVVDAVGPFTVAEDAPDTTVVGPVTATDVDTVGNVTGFNISLGNTGGAFTIDAAGIISVADTSAIDYESATSFTLTVTATDAVNTSVGQAVTIDIGDVNDTAPVVNATGPFALAENSPDTTLVGTVTASDVDTVGTITSFTIVAGNPNNAFTIDAAGAITVATSAELDRETNASFTLTITATDDGTNVSAGEDVVVNLTDLNDTAPVITPGQAFGADSSAPNNTVVGTVIANDADTTGAVTDFSITAGNTGSVFAIATNGQITVADNTNLLAGSPYTLTLTATDGTNTSAAETVSITVTTGGAIWDNFNWDDGSTWQ